MTELDEAQPLGVAKSVRHWLVSIVVFGMLGCTTMAALHWAVPLRSFITRLGFIEPPVPGESTIETIDLANEDPRASTELSTDIVEAAQVDPQFRPDLSTSVEVDRTSKRDPMDALTIDLLRAQVETSRVERLKSARAALFQARQTAMAVAADSELIEMIDVAIDAVDRLSAADHDAIRERIGNLIARMTMTLSEDAVRQPITFANSSEFDHTIETESESFASQVMDALKRVYRIRRIERPNESSVSQAGFDSTGTSALLHVVYARASFDLLQMDSFREELGHALVLLDGFDSTNGRQLGVIRGELRALLAMELPSPHEPIQQALDWLASNSKTSVGERL